MPWGHVWDILDWSSGCVRRIPLNCQQKEGFVKLSSVKLPDLLQFSINKSMSLNQCKSECLKDCSCIAYAKSDIREGGSGCFMWFGDLIDIRESSENNGQDVIYIRMPVSELRNSKNTRLVLILVISLLSGVLILGFLIWCLPQYSKRKRGFETKDEDIEIPMFNLITITVLLETAAGSVKQRLREKETEVQKAVRRKAELEARAAQLNSEVQKWQAKAREQEATTTALRAMISAGSGEGQGNGKECAAA
ncbi:G-type lectin S-receptor-like serine threonine-kinase At4g27290 isoform X1 [Olea europaea subsp. europaea]|uniref:G-type lectin S-receptor-like serine threonine-kinase At4g27290 isoform X1 n=1 Tax=Olea europaea subsp. europaea TaxID=158383 RepID=A0A8S0VN23_OLEEU|nr:G-type lectin S-receptor-like serine threonine-kinase At4g27290 isoform X1 [Olea europaea subsp. europaea]